MSRPHSSATEPSPSSLLSERQRARLLKSSRKLAKVLGTTPLVELTPPSPGPAQVTFSDARRTRTGSRSMDIVRLESQHNSVGRSSSFKLSPAPAARSMKHAESAPPTGTYPTRSWPPEDIELTRPDAAKVPVYRYKVRRSRTPSSFDLSASPPGVRSANSLASFSSTTLVSPLLSPCPSELSIDTLASAVSPAESAHRKKKRIRAREKGAQDMENRRRKMDKLARHLGETPPTDLVFQTSQRSPRRHRAHVRRSRSLSVLIPSTASAGASTDSLRAETATTAALQQNISVAIRTEYVVVESPPPLERINSGESQMPALPPKDNLAVLLPARVGTVPGPPRRAHLRSRSHIPAAPRIASVFNRDSRFEKEGQRRSLREEDEDDDDDDDDEPRMANKLLKSAPQVQHLVVAHRSERRQGWSGEWNAESVQDVIEKLRNLK